MKNKIYHLLKWAIVDKKKVVELELTVRAESYEKAIGNRARNPRLIQMSRGIRHYRDDDGWTIGIAAGGPA